MRRIELLASDWKSEVLPLYDTRTIQTFSPSIIKHFLSLVEGERFELSKTEVNGFTARPICPLWYPSKRRKGIPNNLKSIQQQGFYKHLD